MKQNRERRAWVCHFKGGELHQRVFTMPGDTEPPRCPQHGPMKRQANLPYRKPLKKGRKP